MNHPPLTPDERYAALVDALLGSTDVTLGAAGKTGFGAAGKTGFGAAGKTGFGAAGKTGFGAAALRVHGKIFAMLVTDTLVVKLPRQQVDALIAAGEGERFAPRHDGRLMKEWVVVSPTSEGDWLPLAREALAFVAAQR